MDAARFASIIQTLAPHSRLRRTWSLAGGLSADMTAVEAETATGQIRKWIVRQYRHGRQAHKQHKAETEFKVLQLTHALGLPTPTPCLLDTSGTHFAAPTLAIEYIEGEMVFSPPDLESYLKQLATQLAHIHRAETASLDLSFLPQIIDGCPETGKQRPGKTSLDKGRIPATLASHRPSLHRNAPCLLHGDYWPGNTLWRDGRLTAVIDWEDAKFGDPLIDLANSRLEVGWIFGINGLKSFTRHYQALMTLDYTDLPFWDLCAALRLARLVGPDLAEWAAYFHPFGRHDLTPNSLRQNYDLFVAQAMAALTG